jgi:hypothetical protein
MNKRILVLIFITAALVMAIIVFDNTNTKPVSKPSSIIKCTCGPQGSNRCVANGEDIYICNVKNTECYENHNLCP